MTSRYLRNHGLSVIMSNAKQPIAFIISIQCTALMSRLRLVLAQSMGASLGLRLRLGFRVRVRLKG